MPKHPTTANCQDSFPCLSLKHPTTNWASPNRSPALQRADKKGALPPSKEVPLAPMSALRRAGDHAQHGGGMLERYEGE